MKYNKPSSVRGKWAKGNELFDVRTAKIVGETTKQKSSFLNKDGSKKTQDVCKIEFEGVSEPLNVSLNSASLSALIDAFGEESKDWIGKTLSVETEKMRVAGKAVVAIYLIPAGYKRIDDANGYAMIIKEGEANDEPAGLDGGDEGEGA